MTINRRDLAGIAAIPAGLGLSGASRAQPQEVPEKSAHDAMMETVPGLNLMGSERIAMLIYPQFTALDLVGPQYFLSGLMGANVDLVTTEDTLDPIVSDTGLAITPTRKLADCTPDLDVVFVPGGGMGTLRAMELAPVPAFLRACAEKSRFVTSTCTCSLVLASAGILKGKHATSH